MAPDWLDDFPDYKDFAALVRNIRDPEKIVRIASLRALFRVVALQQRPSTQRFVDRLVLEIERDERDYILGVNFLPPSGLLERVHKILASSDEQDRERARELLSHIARQAESEIRTAREPRATAKVFRAIVSPFDPEHHYGLRPVPEKLLKRINSRFASYLVTSEFARLAMLEWDPRSEITWGASQDIGRQVQTLGPNFEPDIAALFQVYQSFFRQYMQFWFDWLENRKNEGLNVFREMPDWFPVTEGSVLVSRQIEYAVSRTSLSHVAMALGPELQSSDPRDRWAAANLIEWSARYHTQPNSPIFGGGSGPEDVLEFQPDTWQGITTREEFKLEPKETEPQRYTDLTIFEGELYPGDDSSVATQVDETTPLVPDSLYTLEVAIRLKRTGIGAQFEPTRSVKNPRKDQEDLLVYIVADSRSPSIKIEEPFAKVVWPYNSDSESAYFRFKVKQTATSEGLIEVRIYDGSLDLLDIVQLSVSIASQPGTANLPPAKVLWMDNSEGVLDIAVHNPPRLLSIDVGLDPDTSKYKFVFKFLVQDKNIAIPGSSLITADDIDLLLVKVRDFWTELAINNYSTDLKVTRTTFRKYLGQLKELGIQAWQLLFGDRYADRQGASETIAELLQSLKPNEGAHIQITYSNADNFVFPWSILYPPDAAGSEVNPFEFWGAHYQIEQVTAGPKRVDLNNVPINLVFALDPNFADSQLQKQLLKSYQARSLGKLQVSDPISGVDPFFQALVQAPAAHFYYFYCHGYAPTSKSAFKRDGVKVLRELIKALPKAQKKAFETLLNLTAKMNDEPWIFIGDSEIKESKIKTQKFFNKKRPIIFLNMCQSADLAPSLSSGLVRVFLDRNAAAVIGTESPMTGVFANAFSQTFFDELFAGDDIGTALWKARRRFLQDDMRNPLGLAYTLYGRALARVGDGPIIPKNASTVNQQPVSEKTHENGDK